MHDTELEQRLRVALREEADRLPLRVDVEQLEALVVTRRRATRSNRAGLLAAAIGVVAFGIAAVGLNGGLPAGILPGLAPTTPVPCTPLAVTDPSAPDEGTPPEILLVDAAGTVHHGGLDSFRMPGSSTVHPRGMLGGERHLAPGTTSLEITTAEAACLWKVELEVEPPDGRSATTEGSESLEGPVSSLSVSAPPPGKWRATVRATFHTTANAMATSTTIFRLVSTGPATAEPVEPTPSARALPADLKPLEPRPDATILLEVPRTWSGPGTRHVVERPDSTTTIATVWVACVDESVTVDADGVVEGLDHITVTGDDQPVEMPCMGEQPHAVAPLLTDQPTAIEISVPADVAYTVLVETVPIPPALPDIELMYGPVEVDRASEIKLPDWSAEPTVERLVLGTLDEGFAQEATVVCLGPGRLHLEFQAAGSEPTAPPAAGSGFECSGQPQSLSIALGNRGPHEVVVNVDTRTAWHVVAGSDGVLPPFDPPTFRMTSWLGQAEVDGAGTTGIAGCGAGFIVAGELQGLDQCGPPEWIDMTDQGFVIARPAGELRITLDEGWQWDDATVRAAPFLQTGQNEPPVNTWTLTSAVEDEVLVVPVELSASKWVVRIDAKTSNADNGFDASMFFVVDVQP